MNYTVFCYDNYPQSISLIIYYFLLYRFHTHHASLVTVLFLTIQNDNTNQKNRCFSFHTKTIALWSLGVWAGANKDPVIPIFVTTIFLCTRMTSFIAFSYKNWKKNGIFHTFFYLNHNEVRTLLDWNCQTSTATLLSCEQFHWASECLTRSNLLLHSAKYIKQIVKIIERGILETILDPFVTFFYG